MENVISTINQFQHILLEDKFWGSIHVFKEGSRISLLGHLLSKSKNYILRITKSRRNIRYITSILSQAEFHPIEFDIDGFGEYICRNPEKEKEVIEKTSSMFSYNVDNFKKHLKDDPVINRQRNTFNQRAKDLTQIKEQERKREEYSPANLSASLCSLISKFIQKPDNKDIIKEIEQKIKEVK